MVGLRVNVPRTPTKDGTAMKTVPTIRVDAPTADGGGGGLLAMSVAAGMAVMQALFEAEIAAVAGPKGRHDPNRAAVRHGGGRGSVTLGGRRVAVDRPRARTLDGHEVPLTSYTYFAAEDVLTRGVMERMWGGWGTRRAAPTSQRGGPA